MGAKRRFSDPCRNDPASPLPQLAVIIAGIGDLVLASPALRALKRGLPAAPLHLLTSREAAELARNYPYIDRIWEFPVRQLRRRKTTLLAIMRLLTDLRRVRFDRAVNLYHVDSWAGALKMGAVFQFINAQVKIGHGRCGFGFFLDHETPEDFFANRHLTEAMTEMAVLAGGRGDEKGLELFWERESERRCQYLFNEAPEESLGSLGDQRGRPLFVGVNPGGDRANRRWAPERYATVADRIAAALSARIFIFGGPGEEAIAQCIQGQVKSAVVNLAGKLSISDLAYVISRLDLLVTNDSGPMHMAAAAGTPVVAIFGPEDPTLMGPYTSPELYRTIHKPLPCRPCQKDRCQRPLCLEAITADEVFAAAMELIEERRA
ncbi:MAG: glycosyltransferase family 9 protein [Pseudomonadota bacterium]|nr:glycosyltransferase family 9 protein [Pseudomonadota bacterium]